MENAFAESTRPINERGVCRDSNSSYLSGKVNSYSGPLPFFPLSSLSEPIRPSSGQEWATLRNQLSNPPNLLTIFFKFRNEKKDRTFRFWVNRLVYRLARMNKTKWTVSHGISKISKALFIRFTCFISSVEFDEVRTNGFYAFCGCPVQLQ